MASFNLPMVSFNRGIITKTALARTDVDRTRLSAEVMTNFLPKTQGPMIIRPGTQYLGSSYNDTGAAFIEFVAATDATALLELTDRKMRVWLDDALLGRPPVDTTLTLQDTGWYDDSAGGGDTGAGAVTGVDIIPAMTDYTTNGVTISASSEEAAVGHQVWRIADNVLSTLWVDTGSGSAALPSWVNVDFGDGNTEALKKYNLRAGSDASHLPNAPNSWRLIGADYDTGTWATDTGKWYLEDERAGETGWAASERRGFFLSDTGTPDSWRHWRLYVTAVDGGDRLIISEMQMNRQGATDTGQTIFSTGSLTLNAGARGSLARVRKRVVVSDTGTEHSLDINVSRGPVTLRVGSTEGDDDYISEATLNTGYHNLAFTPSGNFHVTVQSDREVDRVIDKLGIGDSGTVEITTPWVASDVDEVRTDQSADVVFADHPSYAPQRIERRGTGRSWSVVDYDPENGPFLVGRSSNSKLGILARRGDTQLTSDIPFFKEGHEGALIRMTHDGQSGLYYLGALDAATDVATVTGINDTGSQGSTNERRIIFSVSGSYLGGVTIERSFDDPTYGFHQVTPNYVTSGSANDTGTFSCTIDDEDDNVTVYYRARLNYHNDSGSNEFGVARVSVTYLNGSKTGIARITGYQSGTVVDAEVIEQFSDTGSVDVWEEGAWSGLRGYPGAAALHEGRLNHAGKASLWSSVSDDFENFDDTTEGDAAPLSKTLGQGPVDSIYYLVSLLRLVAGTAGQELVVKSSSLDEPLTPTNSSVKTFSTQGSYNIRAVKMDSRMFFVQRSGRRVYNVGFGSDVNTVSDYEAKEMTTLVPDLLDPGIVSIAIQRQPDTRLHCVLADGRVAILTYEPQEQVLAWSTWQTDTGTNSAVEKAVVLPGAYEDRVYYHVRRTIGGSTKRFLEKWKLESECQGDTGLSWLADCAVSATNDTGRDGFTSPVGGFQHLAGENIIVWANDTGQSNSYGKDLSFDVDQNTALLDESGNALLDESGNELEGAGATAYQIEYYVNTASDTGDTGKIALAEDVKHVVGGLPYKARFTSTKLAYGAQFGTALAQMKRVDRMALVLHQTHNNAVYFGSDSGNLDPMPRVNDEGAEVDPDKIFERHDNLSMSFPGSFDEDARVHLEAKAPRPTTVMALIPSVKVSEKL